MIEKLKYTEHRSGGEDMTLRIKKIPAQPWEMQDKTNELVDAVNEFQKILHDVTKESVENMARVDSLGNTVLELQTKVNKMAQNLNFAQPDVKENFTTDPYAEQRRWIGKLCRFWFADAEHPTFGILDFVDAGQHPEPFHINCDESEQGWYPHCEPVKPDDDIIYKGE